MAFPALLHSISYAGLWGQASLSVTEFIDKAAELGFDGVMLTAKRPHVSLMDYGPAERRDLRHRMDDGGLKHRVLAGYNNFTADLEHSEVPHFEIQINYITELARLTAELGGSVLRIFTGYENAAAPYSRQWDLVVSALRECSRRAGDVGVIIGVQNHHDIAAGFESFADLFDAVGEENCRPLFDAWAPALHGADLTEGARLLGAATVHTTVANYVKRPRYRYEPALVNYTPQTPFIQAVRMNEGFIDYAAFWRDMYEAGFRGTVAYEMCSPLREGKSIEVLDSHARAFLDALRGVPARAGA